MGRVNILLRAFFTCCNLFLCCFPMLSNQDVLNPSAEVNLLYVGNLSFPGLAFSFTVCICLQFDLRMLYGFTSLPWFCPCVYNQLLTEIPQCSRCMDLGRLCCSITHLSLMSEMRSINSDAVQEWSAVAAIGNPYFAQGLIVHLTCVHWLRDTLSLSFSLIFSWECTLSNYWRWLNAGEWSWIVPSHKPTFRAPCTRLWPLRCVTQGSVYAPVRGYSDAGTAWNPQHPTCGTHRGCLFLPLHFLCFWPHWDTIYGCFVCFIDSPRCLLTKEITR